MMVWPLIAFCAHVAIAFVASGYFYEREGKNLFATYLFWPVIVAFFILALPFIVLVEIGRWLARHQRLASKER